MTLLETEIIIKDIKDYFEKQLKKNLKLYRISAPMFLKTNDGLNDGLNGVEEPIKFIVNNEQLEIIHSLAKWKRYALKLYNINYFEGIYTDMNAIRKDDLLDNIHSIYVDQWDWEINIPKEKRKISYLKSIVKKIYKTLLNTNNYLNKKYSLYKDLPNDIYFIKSQDLENMYPNNTPKEREYLITKKYKAVFIIGIGKKLKSGYPHDGRAFDYDDWNLNGDILVYYDILDIALELSSMGIRVDNNSLLKQAKLTNNLNNLNKEYYQGILNNVLPYSIGGGIGQSRMCMFFMNKQHIGEVQNSYWPLEEINKNKNIIIKK